MTIEILEKNIELNQELENYIYKKVEAFEKILGNEMEVFFRIGKDTKAHKKGKIYFADVRVETPKKTYGAKVEGESEREVVDLVKDEILKKIRRNKGKKESLLKKGGRKIKELLRLK